MRLVRAATLVVIVCPGCPSSQPNTPRVVDDTELRITVARAEARRASGVVELVELATKGAAHARMLALRGLGRIGGPRALDTLVAALSDPDPAIIAAAATAIGLTGSLDESEATPALTSALLAALPRAIGRERDVIEGIGRAADASAQPRLVDGLAGPPDIAEACAIALGRYGRRKIAITEKGRDGLIVATRHASARVRLAAIWALAREYEPEKIDVTQTKVLVAAIAALVKDSDPEVRATALSAVHRRKLVPAIGRAVLVPMLGDDDWRVVVEAARALAGTAPADVARVLLERFEAIDNHPPNAHVVTEGLRALIARPVETRDAAVEEALAEMVRRSTGFERFPILTRGWVHCLATTARARWAETPDLGAVERCGPKQFPDHLRFPLLAELVAAKVGSADDRRAVVRALLAHTDVRVRAAGMTALAKVWPDANERERRAGVAIIVASLDSKDPVIAGNAVDAAGSLYDVVAKGTPERDELDTAIVARAAVETDPELAGALFDVIGKRAIATGVTACRAGLDGAPVRARAAASCLNALGDPVAVPAIGNANVPPNIDLTQVIGRRLRWRITTTRGEFTIVLRPDVAPWAVAAVVMLARKGFYDGLEFHRVVPNFVVQGGDPSQSGWGGPGFTLPAEPSSGPGYVVGGVGMADAGRDSAGSQWFVMHSAAPHLDGRYTWIGAVESGQKSADALVIGDKVTRTTIEVIP